MDALSTHYWDIEEGRHVIGLTVAYTFAYWTVISNGQVLLKSRNGSLFDRDHICHFERPQLIIWPRRGSKLADLPCKASRRDTRAAEQSVERLLNVAYVIIWYVLYKPSARNQIRTAQFQHEPLVYKIGKL